MGRCTVATAETLAFSPSPPTSAAFPITQSVSHPAQHLAPILISPPCGFNLLRMRPPHHRAHQNINRAPAATKKHPLNDMTVLGKQRQHSKECSGCPLWTVPPYRNARGPRLCKGHYLRIAAVGPWRSEFTLSAPKWTGG